MDLHRTALAVALAVLVMGTAGAARAFFASPAGSGTGALPVPPLTGVTISPGEIAGGLRPGGTAALAVVAANANPVPVRIASLGLSAVTADTAACVNPAIAVAPQTNGGAGWVIPANGSLSIRVANAVAMGWDADSACQGATFTVQLQAGA